MRPLISLCIPTNGVIEWVFPVLESIYSQNIDCSLYEVIVTDNGRNVEFKRRMMEYSTLHKNLIYEEAAASGFVNEIESYKKAKGDLVKFINHRTKLVPGALEKLIEFAEQNETEKPIIYFANGVLNIPKERHTFNSFDQFVNALSYWSSWSTGMAFWREDFERLPEDTSTFNELFPHTDILFSERNRGKYIIDNTIILNEIPSGNKPKGNYDLFFAFGVEYPWIICNLLREKSISTVTFRKVTNANLLFVAGLYFSYIIRKQYCSYDLSGLKNMFGVFYTKKQMRRKLYMVLIRGVFKKVKRLIGGVFRHRIVNIIELRPLLKIENCCRKVA